MPYTDELHGFAHWGAPLSGDSPCGEDISLDEVFDQLNDEIGKDKSLHSEQKTDWVAVLQLADSLLTRSKDLWPFSYGIIAVFHTKTAQDCANCVTSLSELLTSQWQPLYPSLKRPKRRIAPLKWLCDKFHTIAENTAFLNLTPSEITALNSAFSSLQDTIDSVLPDNDLSFRSILATQLHSGQEAGGSESGSGPAQQKSTGAAARATTQPIRKTLDEIEKSSIIPHAVLPQVIRAINDNARQLGDHLLALSKEDERPYLLHRIAMWATLLQLPPSDSTGQTQLYCPVPADVADMYKAGVKEKRFSEVLPQIEQAASKAPFWFDGQHLIVLCLEGLSYTLPAISIKHALAQLFQRFPEIVTLKFNDGTPFASPKTATWVESFIPSLIGTNPFGVSAQSFTSDSPHADEAKLLQEAIALSLDKDFKDGLAVLGSVPPGKNRAFLRHCLLKAKFCSVAGQTQAAGFLLKSIIGKLKNWDLLDWEPELTAEAVSLLFSVSSKQKEPDEELLSLMHTFTLEAAIQ